MKAEITLLGLFGIILISGLYIARKGPVNECCAQIGWYYGNWNQETSKTDYYRGMMYEYGFKVNQSDEEAVKWYQKAAEQGDNKAQYVLGMLYEQGRGVKQSDTEAFKWYNKAAEQWNGNAMTAVAKMYDEQGHLMKNFERG